MENTEKKVLVDVKILDNYVEGCVYRAKDAILKANHNN